MTDANRDEYRGLMSAIFFDYHLFQRLYGIRDAEPGEIDRLLAQFRLTDKTSLTDGEFRTLDLGRVKAAMRQPIVVDLRNIYRGDEMTALGFQYESLGRGRRAQPVPFAPRPLVPGSCRRQDR